MIHFAFLVAPLGDVALERKLSRRPTRRIMRLIVATARKQFPKGTSSDEPSSLTNEI
jgi:hypothetical protein